MSRTRIAGIVSGAAGVAGIAAGTACALVARSRHNSAVSNVNQDYDKAQSQQSQAHDLAIGANVGFIAGGVLAVLGVVLYFIGAPDSQPATPDTHMHLMPALAPGFAGINAGGTW
jgi:hypothetical protein